MKEEDPEMGNVNGNGMDGMECWGWKVLAWAA
jgi:hypothetical protein